MGKQTNNLPSAEDIKRQDNNRPRAIAAIRQLQRLLALATHPQFDGTISVELSAKRGFLARHKFAHVQYDPDDEQNGG